MVPASTAARRYGNTLPSSHMSSQQSHGPPGSLSVPIQPSPSVAPNVGAPDAWVAARARPNRSAASMDGGPGAIHSSTRCRWLYAMTSGTDTPPDTARRLRSPAASVEKKPAGASALDLTKTSRPSASFARRALQMSPPPTASRLTTLSPIRRLSCSAVTQFLLQRIDEAVRCAFQLVEYVCEPVCATVVRIGDVNVPSRSSGRIVRPEHPNRQ